MTDLYNRDLEKLKQKLNSKDFSAQDVVKILRRNDLSQEIIKIIGNEPKWVAEREVKVGIVNHRNAPRTMALNLLDFLTWKETAELCGNNRAQPAIRRNAEKKLRNKLENMALGEKLSLVKTPNRGVVRVMRDSNNPKIIKALLKNPVLTEKDILHLINSNNVSSGILRSIGRSKKWSRRYKIKLQLIRNPRTPDQISLSLITGVMKNDLKELIKHPNISSSVKKAARKQLNRQS